MSDQMPGEFHHFQLPPEQGAVPLSVSVLVHVNRPDRTTAQSTPLTADDVLQFHKELKNWNGNLRQALKPRRKTPRSTDS